MSTMGIAVYCNSGNSSSEREQLMLLRTLQDNECNIIGNNNNNNSNLHNNNQAPTSLAPKNNVSVINVATSQQSENERRAVLNSQQSSNVLPPYDPSRLKKHGKNGQPPPIAVAKRNLRERNRVKQVNNGFAKLRQHIPSQIVQGYGDRGKKLSKVETLRMALDYIRGLERLLAEADGLDYDSISGQSASCQPGNSPMMPSPSGSVYSSSTHNGSGDVLGLTGSELDEQHSAEHLMLEDEHDADNYLMEEDECEAEAKDRRDAKRFRGDEISQNRLSENQNRAMSGLARRSRHSPAAYYASRQTPVFGDEENIEPLVNHNNNSIASNGLLASYSPILLASGSPTSLPSIKREQQRPEEEEEVRRSPETEVAAPHNLVFGPASSASPYAGEILVESPESGRLVPVKFEEPEGSGQFVYVAAASPSAEAYLPGASYYKHVEPSPPVIADPSSEFMDVVSWWEQEQGRFVHQLQSHHHALAQPLQQSHQPTHQQLAAAGQRLAHV